MNTQKINLKTQDEIQKSFFHIPFWIAPKSDIFALRATRFAELASDDQTDWKDYLSLLSRICEVQQSLLKHASISLPVTDAESELSLPDIDTAEIPAAFDLLLQPFFDKIKPHLTVQSQESWEALLAMDSSVRKNLAQRILAQDLSEQDYPYSIWVHAILQIIWTNWAMHLQEADVPPREEREFCPCCASDAVGSVILNGGELEGLRYLQCNLCNSRWHALRAKCTFCANTKDISFESIEGQKEGVLYGASAECCDVCHGYRKSYDLMKEQHADAVADDLASLPIDILLAEKGYLRGGINPYLILEQELTH
jgi:FdhE protein